MKVSVSMKRYFIISSVLAVFALVFLNPFELELCNPSKLVVINPFKFELFNPFRQLLVKESKMPAPKGNALVILTTPLSIKKIDSIQPTALRSKDDPDYVPGIVEPFMDVTLGLFVPGRINRILFAEGRKVRKGQTILYLDKSQEELEAARRKMIWQNRSELILAQVTVRTLTESLKLNKELYDETRSVSKEELDKLSLQWEAAVAEQNRLIVQEKREKVEYEMALIALESRFLKAPFSGVVEKVVLKEGEIYQSSQPLVRLIDSDRCLITANLDDTRSYRLQQGMIVDLLINVGETEVKKRGVIIKVPQVVDPASGVMQVKVSFDNSDGSIKPGVTGRMRLPKM